MKKMLKPPSLPPLSPQGVVKILIDLVIFLNLLVLSAGGVIYTQHRMLSSKEALLAERNRELEDLLLDKSLAEGVIDVGQAKIKSQELILKQKTEELEKVNDELGKSKEALVEAQKELAAKLAEIKSKEEKIRKQEAQLSANAKELEELRRRPPLFSFQKRTQRDVEKDKAEVREIVEAAYPEIEAVFSSPYLLHQITISFVDSFSREGSVGETYISNSSLGLEIDIRIKSFSKDSFEDVNTIIHEIVHAFHGLAILLPVPYEEGIAVATADLVMDRLQAKGRISIGERFLDHNIDPFSISIPLDYEAFYSSRDVYKYYQAVGEAWWRIEKNSPGTIKRFNELWYKKIQVGEESNAGLIKATLAEVCPSCRLAP
jgi:hypothetical protein